MITVVNRLELEDLNMESVSVFLSWEVYWFSDEILRRDFN